MPEAHRSVARTEWVLGGLLVVATLVAYQHVWHAGFIWDDDRHLTQNPTIVGPLGLREIWTTRAARICPLVLTTFWVEHALWGLNPLPYHLVNVLMHTACGLVLWRVLRSLQVPGAWLGAALWTLHPVQVETVAWVTELKNTQSCFFYLLGGFFFLKWIKREKPVPSLLQWNYAAAALCCALAMASKSSTVILPVVLGLCAWWVDRRWRWRTAIGLVPVALMSLATSALSIWTQHLEGANDPQWDLSWPARLAVAGRVFWFYLGKLLWPHPLVFIYPRWNIDSTQIASYLPTAAMFALLLFLGWSRKGKLRPAFFAAACFLAALLPVLGLVQQFFLRYSFVGDHFQYLASMGPLALAAAGITTGFGALRNRGEYPYAFLSGTMLLVLGFLTWRQSAIYADVKTLWLATNARNPQSWLVHNNLGIIYSSEGSTEAAIEQYRQVAAINPGFSGTYSNLGIALMKERRVDDAINEFRRALAIDPVDPETHNNLGNAYRRKGWMDQAVDEFQTALKIDPRDVVARVNLGNSLQRMGRMGEALIQFQKALEIEPNNSGAHYGLGNALAQSGRMEEALAQYQEASRLEPGDPRIHTNLGAVFLKLGRMDDAIVQFREATEIDPGNADTHVNLGQTLMQRDRLDEAIAEYQKALEITPNDAEVRRDLDIAIEQKQVEQAPSGRR
jgi:Flp pilus assembly protein TadD